MKEAQSWILMLVAADRLADRGVPVLRFLGKNGAGTPLAHGWRAHLFPGKKLSGGFVLIRSQAVQDVGGLSLKAFFMVYVVRAMDTARITHTTGTADTPGLQTNRARALSSPRS